jgi:hypothetical protein
MSQLAIFSIGPGERAWLEESRRNARLAVDLLGPNWLDAASLERAEDAARETLRTLEPLGLVPPSWAVPVRRIDPRADTERLADRLAAELREVPPPTVSSFALRHRDELVRLRLVRHDSHKRTVLRRLQEFLTKHVYGVRIPLDKLPPRVRRGLETGGRRKVKAAR